MDILLAVNLCFGDIKGFVVLLLLLLLLLALPAFNEISSDATGRSFVRNIFIGSPIFVPTNKNNAVDVCLRNNNPSSN